MTKIFGVNIKIRGKEGEYIYRQTKVGTIISELPVKPVILRRTARQMDRRAQWFNLGAIYKQFGSMLRKGYEDLPVPVSWSCATSTSARWPSATAATIKFPTTEQDTPISKKVIPPL